MCILNNTYSNVVTNQLLLNHLREILRYTRIVHGKIFQYNYQIIFLACFHVLQMCMHYMTHFKLVLCSNQNSFSDTKPRHQLSNPNTYPSSHILTDYKLKDNRNKHNRYSITQLETK